MKSALKETSLHPEFYSVSIILSSFIVLSSMLASMDEIGKIVGIKFPLFSVLSLLFARFLAPYKTDGLRKINLVLVPLSVALICSVILSEGRFSAGGGGFPDAGKLSISAPLMRL